MEKEIIELLKKKALSVTEPRKKILSLFVNTKGALEHASIEKTVKTLDRVTIYRTLQSFMAKGLIHTIPTKSNSIKYALCKDCCGELHHDNHVHFKCDRCGQTICLDEVTVPVIKLPAQYTWRATEMIINGICENCHNTIVN